MIDETIKIIFLCFMVSVIVLSFGIILLTQVNVTTERLDVTP